MRFNLLLLVIPSLVFGDPWGKDADLVYPTSPSNCEDPSLGIKISQALIRFHQDVISPADGPRSNFFPSSSQYTYDAITQYGFCQGFMMGCDRLMRENDDPWIYSKIRNPEGRILKSDPVR